MIKIEVRIRKTVGEVSMEHEYRAELPDDATAEQIKAVGAEAEQTALLAQESEEEAPPPSIAWNKQQ
jgi:hypothetical protein